MVKFNHFFIKAVKDVLSFETMKLALMTGIPIMTLWIGVGWLFWEPVTALTSQVLTWIPFSIIKANGAFVIAFFLWFLAVMVSYSFMVSFFNALFYRFVEKPLFEFVNVVLVLILSVGWSLAIIFNWESIYAQIGRLLVLLPFDTVDQAISYLLAIYLFYNLFVITLYITVFFFREPFLLSLKELHYPDTVCESASGVSGVYALLVRDGALFALFMVAVLPLLFIPVANFLAIVFLWTWLYKESAFMGVCSLCCGDYEKESYKEHRLVIWVAAFVASLLNFIPVLAFLTPFFVMALYFHWIMHEKSRS